MVGKDNRVVTHTNRIENMTDHEDPLSLLLQNEESEDDTSSRTPKSDRDALTSKMQRHGLKKRNAAVVASRLLEGKTFEVIANEQGYSDPSAARNAFNGALRKLKKRGYQSGG